MTHRIVRPLYRSALAGILISLSACGGEPSDSLQPQSQGEPGRLVVIGGGLQAENTAVYQAILDGRDGEGPICVFPTASAEPRESVFFSAMS